MNLQAVPLKVFLTQARIQKVLSLSAWRSLLGVMSAMVLGALLRMHSLQLRLGVAGALASEIDLVSWDDSCLPDLRWWSVVSHLVVGVPLDLPRPDLFLFMDASDTGWGASLADDHLSSLWPPGSTIFDQPPGASGGPLRSEGFSSSARTSVCGFLFGQHYRPFVSSQGGWHPFLHSEHHRSIHPPSVRV